MAVYTKVSESEATEFLRAYDIGELRELVGIKQGIQNTNYVLYTTKGRYILTLYEPRNVREEDLPFFLGLMEHLAGKGIACPLPVRARDGAALRRLAERPAAIVTFLTGMWPRRVAPAHCDALGRALAEFHAAGADFASAMGGPRDVSEMNMPRRRLVAAPTRK